MIQSGKFDSLKMDIKKLANTILFFTIKRLIEILGILISFIGIFLFISFITYSPDDPNFIFPENTKIKNLLGIQGSYISDLFFQSVGLIAYLIPITYIFSGINIFKKKEIFLIIENSFFIILYLIFGSIFFSFFYKNAFTLYINGNGGFVGNYLSNLFSNNVNSSYENIIYYALILLISLFFLISINFNVKNFISSLNKIYIFLFKKKDKSYTNKNEIINEYIPQEEIKNLIQDDLHFIKTDTNQISNKSKFKLPSLDLLKKPEKKEKNKMGKIFNISNNRVNLNIKHSENSFNYWDTEVKYNRIDSILDMCEEIHKYDDTYILQNSKKYYKPIIKTKIWSSNGFTNIKWVIQHKTNKKIYRIHTTTGIVDVTEDHSLINEDRIVVKPNQVQIGDKLLVNDIQKNIIDKLDIMNDIELQQYPELLDILQNSYRVNKNDYLIKLDKIHNYSKSLISKLYWYFKYKLGYYTEIISKEDSYIFYNTNLKVNHGLVTKIEIMDDYEDFVYDIETDDHTFHAGIGNIIVHNTDSVFVKFNLEYEDGSYPETDLDKIQRSIDIGMEIQQKLKDDRTFPEPHDLEYEKVFYPLILIQPQIVLIPEYE